MLKKKKPAANGDGCLCVRSGWLCHQESSLLEATHDGSPDWYCPNGESEATECAAGPDSVGTESWPW